MDLSNLTPAPWELVNGAIITSRDGELYTALISFYPPADPQPRHPNQETDLKFIALARNAFDGDSKAFAWWEENRRKSRAMPEFNPALSATDNFLADLRAEWEACGPWVPDDSLTPDGLETKRAFQKLLADDRLKTIRVVR